MAISASSCSTRAAPTRRRAPGRSRRARRRRSSPPASEPPSWSRSACSCPVSRAYTPPCATSAPTAPTWRKKSHGCARSGPTRRYTAVVAPATRDEGSPGERAPRRRPHLHRLAPATPHAFCLRMHDILVQRLRQTAGAHSRLSVRRPLTAPVRPLAAPPPWVLPFCVAAFRAPPGRRLIQVTGHIYPPFSCPRKLSDQPPF